jgi:hypothetical protein
MEICTAADDGRPRDAISKLNQLLRPDRCCHFCGQCRFPAQGTGRAGTWVGLDGLEPSTSALSGRRSNRLSYRPLPAAPGARVARQTPREMPPRKATVLCGPPVSQSPGG